MSIAAMLILALALALALPTAAGYLLVMGVRASRRVADRRRPPPPEPPDRLTARLRRLRTELEATEAGPGLAKHHHVTALRGALMQAETRQLPTT
ncbi:MAG TPA: hypothetical protein VGG25_01835 [Streptosporangiaceae bacterium]|jgi:hypothetical protein